MSVFKKLSIMLCMGVFVIGISGCPERKKEGPVEGAGEKVEQLTEQPAEATGENTEEHSGTMKEEGEMEDHGGMEEHGGTIEEKTEEQPAQ